MKKSWTIKDSFSSYKGKLEEKKYTKVLKEFFWEISNIIIRNKYCYRFGKIGKIYVARARVPLKNSKKKIDYQYYKSTGKIKYLINTHTDGYYYFFKWEKNRFLKNRLIYKFIVNRGNDYIIGARGLAKHIKECANNPNMKDYTTKTIV